MVCVGILLVTFIMENPIEKKIESYGSFYRVCIKRGPNRLQSTKSLVWGVMQGLHGEDDL